MEEHSVEPDFLLDLPVELTDLILSYVSHSKWQFKMRKVCKKWMTWISISDFKLGSITAADIGEIADSFAKYTTLIGLNFATPDIDLIRTFQYSPISKLTNLTSLKIAQQEVTDGEDPIFISALTNLEILEVQFIPTRTIQHLTKLRQLEAIVFQLHDFYDEQTDKIPLNLPFLENAAFIALNEKELPPIFSSAPQLTQLTLKKFFAWEKGYFTQLTSLKKLQIDAKVEEIVRVAIDTPLPNLEYLYSSGNVTFFDTMQKLTYLQLWNRVKPSHNNTNNVGYMNVSFLTNLQILKIRGLQQYHQDLDLGRLTQLSTVELAKYFDEKSIKFMPILQTLNYERLQELLLGGMPYGAEDLQQITKFSNLKSLDISFEYRNIPSTIADVTPVMVLTNLETLRISGNTLLHNNGLTKLGKLKDLSITAINIAEFKELETTKGLTRFKLYKQIIIGNN